MSIRVVIASVPYREQVIAELWDDDVHLAEIWHDDEGLRIEVYETKRSCLLDEYTDALLRARKDLGEEGRAHPGGSGSRVERGELDERIPDL